MGKKKFRGNQIQVAEHEPRDFLSATATDPFSIGSPASLSLFPAAYRLQNVVHGRLCEGTPHVLSRLAPSFPARDDHGRRFACVNFTGVSKWKHSARPDLGRERTRVHQTPCTLPRRRACGLYAPARLCHGV